MRNFVKSATAFGLAVSMLAAPTAMAQQYQHSDQGDQHMAPMQHTPMQGAPMQHEQMQHEPMQHQPMPAPHHQVAMAHHWQHGQRYTGSRRVVGNWSHYHLRQPPHGYEWVQDGGQFVLIAVASGVIADVILNGAYQ